MEYLDFEVEVSPGDAGEYAVHVRSEYGEASATMRLPFDTLALQNRLQALQIALLRSASATRRAPTPEEDVAQKFGRELFDALFAQGPLLGRFEAARDGAWERSIGLRVRLQVDAAELAALPWEYMYDSSRGDFLGLSINTPLVRYIPLPRPVRPLAIAPPIRILGLVAESSDLPKLDAARERQRLEAALQPLTGRGIFELQWLPSGTWRDLQAALLEGPWHIFHFVGHGGFDRVRGEGFVYLSDDGGKAARMSATSLGRLLGDHDQMRLAVLNSCEGASGDDIDVFSSTAAALVQRGTPGVIAMQYPITDRAAIEFSRSFYGAIATGTPVDTALAVARKAISFELPDSLEWGTPALFLRAPDGVLFTITEPIDVPVPEDVGLTVAPAPATEKPVEAPAPVIERVPEPIVVPAAAAPGENRPPDPTPVMEAPTPTPVIAASAAPVQAVNTVSPGGSDTHAGADPLPTSTQASLLALRTLFDQAWSAGYVQTFGGGVVGLVAIVLIATRLYDSLEIVLGIAVGWLVGAAVVGIALNLSNRPGARLTALVMVALTPILAVLGLWSEGGIVAVALGLIFPLLARGIALWRLGRKKAPTA